MKQHRFAAKPGEPKTVIITVRLTENEHQELLRRVGRSNARFKSEYLRAAWLTGVQLYLRDERADMDAVLSLIGAIQQAPNSQAKELALEEAMETLRRMAR